MMFEEIRQQEMRPFVIGSNQLAQIARALRQREQATISKLDLLAVASYNPPPPDDKKKVHWPLVTRSAKQNQKSKIKSEV